MSELFETINTQAAEAAARDQQEAEAAQMVEEDRRARQARKRQRQRRLATLTFLLRVVCALVLIVALCFSCKAELITVHLARTAVAVIASWLAFWGGAWVQYMFAKGGLLNVCAE